jgi:hypothetical protein
MPQHFENPLLPPTLRFATDPNLGTIENSVSPSG